MTTVILTVLVWAVSLPPFQDIESQVADLLQELMRPEPAVQEQALRKLASLRGARPFLEAWLSKTDDPILRARLRDSIRECDREEQRRSLVEAMARATAEGYRPLAERVTSGDASQVLHLLREMLPFYFGDPKREEFRILVCAALRAEGEGEAWDRVRIEALRLLRRGLAHEDSIQAAAEMLRHRTASVRRDALYTLAFLQAEGETALVASLLSDREGDVRREAIRTLEALRSTAHIPAIGTLVQDPAPAVRIQAALTLARLGAAEFSTRIVSLVSDAEAEVRQAGIRALGLLRARSFAGTIARRLGDSSNAVRIEAIEALAAIGAADQAQRIAEELHSSSPEVRVKALEALARLGAKEQAARAARLLGDSDPRVRAAAAMALAGLRESARAVELVPLLQDADAWVRRSAIQALVLLGDAGQGEAIAGRLADRDPSVVTAALRAIGDLRLFGRGADALQYAFVETLTDQFGSSIHLSMGDLIRAEALETVGRLGDRSLAPKVAEFTADASPAVRRAAARALVRLEGLANPDRLVTLLADPDPSVGYETMMAINLCSAPGLAGRLQVEIETPGRESLLLKNSLAVIRDKAGLEISAAPDVAGLFQLPLALPSPVALDTVLHALARDSGFEVGYVADPSGSSLRAMRRHDAVAELKRAIRSGK